MAQSRREAGCTGSRTEKQEPSPGALRTEIEPPCGSVIRFASASPRPVPLVLCEASPWQNFSKMCFCTSPGIPMPVSEIETVTQPGSVVIRVVMVPPSGVNLMALE